MSRITVNALADTVAKLADAQKAQGEQIAKILAAVSRNSTPTLVAETVAPTVHEAAAHAYPTFDEAKQLVAAGADPWKTLVLSSVTGKPIPFGKLPFSLRGALPKVDKTAKSDTAKAPKTDTTVKVTPAKDASMLKLSGTELAALGTKAALAEIARRKANRDAKAAAKA
jgi:hypothetical protein